jgi:hypothetical protein
MAEAAGTLLATQDVQETSSIGQERISLAFTPRQVRSSILDEKQRIVRAVISTADVDRYNTIVDPNGLDAGPFFMSGAPVLWDHGMHAPIGSVPIGNALKIYAKDGKLVAEWKFADFSDQPVEKWGPHARFVEDLWYLYKNGHLGAYSISFIPKDVEYNGDKPPVFRSWELVEFSLVSLPANPHATVLDEKACRLYRRCVGPQRASELLQQAVNEEIALRAEEIATAIVRNALSAERSTLSILRELQRSVKIQSLHFKKEKFSKDEAIAWAKEHGFRADKVDETENEWRLRQFDPQMCQKDSFGTREITDGVLAIFCEVPEKSQQDFVPSVFVAPEDGMNTLTLNATPTKSTNDAVNVEARAIQVNKVGVAHAKSLISAGKIDAESDWSFEAADGNKILDSGGFEEYQKWFLAIDTSANEETKERFKFPYGKEGKVFRRGVIAAKQRAAQQGYTAIAEVADELLTMIDEKIGKEEKALDELIAQALQVDKLLEANALLAESVQTLSEENARLAKENASLRKIIRVLSSKHKE